MHFSHTHTNITTIFFFSLQNHNAANIKPVHQVECSSGAHQHLRLRCLRVLRRCAGEDLPSVVGDVISSDKPPNPPQTPSALCPVFPARPLSGRLSRASCWHITSKEQLRRCRQFLSAGGKKRERAQQAVAATSFPHPLRSFGSFKSLLAKPTT